MATWDTQRRIHTMADDKNHMITVAGKAIIYRTRLVKLHKRKKLPMNPKASERPLRVSSLVYQQRLRQYKCQGTTYHCGSGIVTPLSSAPSGSLPLLGRSTFHLETRPAIDSRFASGPIVAASRGIAVDANHHDLLVY